MITAFQKWIPESCVRGETVQKPQEGSSGRDSNQHRDLCSNELLGLEGLQDSVSQLAGQLLTQLAGMGSTERMLICRLALTKDYVECLSEARTVSHTQSSIRFWASFHEVGGSWWDKETTVFL